MLSKEQIIALRPKVDVVSTDIPPETGVFITGDLRTVKFDSLITQAKLLWVKDRAAQVFYRMLELGFYCPHISIFHHNREPNCIRFRWKEEDRTIIIELHKDERHTIALGVGIQTTSISGYEPFNTFLEALEELHDPRSKDKESASREEHLD